MASFKHPASINVFQRFRQASSVMHHTTRAKNPAWYQEALELDFQLHIRTDGPSITTFYHDRKTSVWSNGPLLSNDVLQDLDRLKSLIAETIKYTRLSGATSLGVIVHIADEFSTAELKPELNHSELLSKLRDAATSNPSSILEDASIVEDQGSWRVLPYSAIGTATIATTVTVSKQHSTMLALFREAGNIDNFPIITHALSAPLVSIMGLNRLIAPSLGKPYVAILQYPWFTVLAFFNENSDLKLIRTLQHRGLRRPTNFRNSLATTNASLEFTDPDLFLLRLGANVDSSLDVDLRVIFTSSRVETVQQSTPDGVPSWSPEPVIVSSPYDASTLTVTSQTFSILNDGKWALQDFHPPSQEAVETYPNYNEIKLLRIARLARIAIYMVAIISAVYTIFSSIELTRQSEWSFDLNQTNIAQQRLQKFTNEKKRLDFWDNLLADRSKAWVNMEALSRMFPENGGMLLKTYSYLAKPEMEKMKTAETIGIVKDWKISGYAQYEALTYLNTINTQEGISSQFDEIASVTGNNSFSSDAKSRNLTINVRTQENNSYKPAPPELASKSDESNYPYSFEISITQRFETTDPLALNSSKAP